jgi:hypothetical protein
MLIELLELVMAVVGEQVQQTIMAREHQEVYLLDIKNMVKRFNR